MHGGLSMIAKHIEDGGSIILTPIKKNTYLQRTGCCDCALFHDMEYKLLSDGTLKITYWLNRRSTSQARRYAKVGKDIVRKKVAKIFDNYEAIDP